MPWKKVFHCALSVIATSGFKEASGRLFGIRNAASLEKASMGVQDDFLSDAENYLDELPNTAIVLLGQSLDPGGSPPGTLASRAQEAAKAYREHESAAVIVASGADPAQTGITEAEAARQLLVTTHGLPGAHIHKEVRANNTVQNAIFSLPIVRALGAHKVILVTSDFHMPRAMYTFEAVFNSLAGSSAPSLVRRPAIGGCPARNAPPGAPINSQSLIQRLRGEKIIITDQLHIRLLPSDLPDVKVPSPGTARVQQALDEVEAMLVNTTEAKLWSGAPLASSRGAAALAVAAAMATWAATSGF